MCNPILIPLEIAALACIVALLMHVLMRIFPEYEEKTMIFGAIGGGCTIVLIACFFSILFTIH